MGTSGCTVRAMSASNTRCTMGTGGRTVRAMGTSNTRCSITSAGAGASMSTLSPIASNTACGIVAVVSV
jgi:hypothetical protein